MKQTENEMNVNVPLEVIKASEIEPKEGKCKIIRRIVLPQKISHNNQ